MEKVTSYTFSDEITVVFEYRFKKHPKLIAVTFNRNIQKIGAYAFYNCTGLKFNKYT